MGGSEILLILLAILVLFGADKLPGFARSLAKGLGEVKKATDEVKEELTKHTSGIVDELKEVSRQGISHSDSLKDTVSEMVSDLSSSASDAVHEDNTDKRTDRSYEEIYKHLNQENNIVSDKTENKEDMQKDKQDNLNS
jgi:sec-independent protein translocase protein TatA